MTWEEFEQHAESQPRFIASGTGVVNQREWDRALLTSGSGEGGIILNEFCAEEADDWTMFCNNRLPHHGWPDIIFDELLDYTIDGTCNYADPDKRAECELRECAFESCFKQRDLYIEHCASETQSLLSNID